MIYSGDDFYIPTSFPFRLDFPRPSFEVSGPLRQFWTDFHQIVEMTEYPVVANRLYPVFRQQLAAKKPFAYQDTSGKRYGFWFQTRQARDNFHSRIECLCLLLGVEKRIEIPPLKKLEHEG